LRETDWPGPGLVRPGPAVLDARQRQGLSKLLGLSEERAEAPVPEPPAPARPSWRQRIGPALPLAAILVGQAALTVRLIWSNTAYQDEALYLWAGHLQLSHWLHGTAIPPFATYFSGAPVLYPPLGALADSLGGLAGARLLSLACMLGATWLLWRTTAALYSRRAACYAAILFALLGPTLHIGAFATFDAPALLLLALGTWFVVKAGQRGEGTGWLVAAAGAVVLANATAYSSAIFDPVLIAAALVTGPGWSRPKLRKESARRAAGLFGYVFSLIILAVTIGGGYYSTGISETVLARASGATAPLHVLEVAAAWTGLITVLAGLCAAVAWRRDRAAGLRRLLPLVLFGAALLAPLQQARIHTLISLDKHVDIGAWFAAIAAGYLVDALVTWLRRRTVRVIASAVAGVALVVPAVQTTAQAAVLYSWPNAAAFVTEFPSFAGPSGRLLVENPSIGEYYLPIGKQWRRWSNTRSVILPSGRSLSSRVGAAGSPALFAQEISRGYFATVALNFAATPALDRKIAQDLNANHDYELAATIPYGTGAYTIWELTTRKAVR
jgi:hypothetical protein